MRGPRTQADLEHLECGNPRCTTDHSETGLALHAACHPSSPVDAWYRKGVLSFRCKRCSALVVEIAVAKAPPA